METVVDICKFEYITCDMEIAVKSLNLVLSKFDNDLDDNYSILLEHNCIEIYDELESYKFIIKQLASSLNNLCKKYKEQIDLHYSKS